MSIYNPYPFTFILNAKIVKGRLLSIYFNCN